MSLSNNKANPYACDEAQSPTELFEIMNPPPINFDPYNDKPVSTKTFAARADAHAKVRSHAKITMAFSCACLILSNIVMSFWFAGFMAL